MNQGAYENKRLISLWIFEKQITIFTRNSMRVPESLRGSAGYLLHQFTGSWMGRSSPVSFASNTYPNMAVHMWPDESTDYYRDDRPAKPTTPQHPFCGEDLNILLSLLVLQIFPQFIILSLFWCVTCSINADGRHVNVIWGRETQRIHHRLIALWYSVGPRVFLVRFCDCLWINLQAYSDSWIIPNLHERAHVAPSLYFDRPVLFEAVWYVDGFNILIISEHFPCRLHKSVGKWGRRKPDERIRNNPFWED